MRHARPARRRAGRGTTSASTSRAGCRGSRRGSGAGRRRSSSRSVLGSCGSRGRAPSRRCRCRARRAPFVSPSVPAPRASTALSFAVCTTGVPAGRPVSAAASAVSGPITSPGSCSSSEHLAGDGESCVERSVVAPLPRVGVDRPLQQDVVGRGVAESTRESMREVARAGRRVGDRGILGAGRAGRRGRPSS